MRTKPEIIKDVAVSTGATQGMAGKVIEAFLLELEKDLITSQKASIPNFGTFTVKNMAARTGRNPATGERVEIAASKKISFRPAPRLKGSV